MVRCALALLTVGACAASAPPATGPGERLATCAIRGRVVDEARAPLEGATIALITDAADAADEPVNAIAAVDGGFALPPLVLPADARLTLYYADLVYAVPLTTCPAPRRYVLDTERPGNTGGDPPYLPAIE